MRPTCALALLLIACTAGRTTRCDGETCPAGACIGGVCMMLVLDAHIGEDGGQDSGQDGGAPRSVDSGPRPDAARTCTRTETPERTCNMRDDDCDGYIDNIDIAGDGFCDCLRIGVIGAPGQNASSSFQAWLEERGTRVERFGTEDDDTALTLAMLEDFDVVILDQLTREYLPEEAETLRTFVEGGGGVMSMTGYNGRDVDRARPNTLLREFGLAYAEGLHDGPIVDWAPHPISRGITSVTFDGGYAITELEDASNTVVGRIGPNIAALAQERGTGRVFVFGDEWIQFDSEWRTMPAIGAFWSNILSWLGPRDRCFILI